MRRDFKKFGAVRNFRRPKNFHRGKCKFFGT
jgi:hypothetical protein